MRIEGSRIGVLPLRSFTVKCISVSVVLSFFVDVQENDRFICSCYLLRFSDLAPVLEFDLRTKPHSVYRLVDLVPCGPPN